MTMRLYDLALADEEIRPSPYCWLVKFALLHKCVDFVTVPLRFAEKENYPDQEHARVPVLQAGEEIIADSARILAWLDRQYPEKPFVATDAERAAGDFYQAWLGAQLYPALAPMMLVRVWAHVHADDKEYFRRTREERLGATLEEAAARPGLKEGVEKALQTLAAPLARHKFLGGEEANISDYVMIGPFLWQRSVGAHDLYEAPQAVDAWRERMLDLFDGYARKAKTAE